MAYDIERRGALSAFISSRTGADQETGCLRAARTWRASTRCSLHRIQAFHIEYNSVKKCWVSIRRDQSAFVTQCFGNLRRLHEHRSIRNLRPPVENGRKDEDQEVRDRDRCACRG